MEFPGSSSNSSLIWAQPSVCCAVILSIGSYGWTLSPRTKVRQALLHGGPGTAALLATRVYFLFCPRTVWPGSPWGAGQCSPNRDSGIGLLPWPNVGSQPLRAKAGRQRRGSHGGLYGHTSLSPPQPTSQDLVTWSQPKCQGGWKTRSSLRASLCHALFQGGCCFFFFSITNNNSANVFCYLSLGHFYQISRIRIAGSKDIDISFLMPNFSVTLDVLILVAGSLPKKIVIIYIFTKNI